jgi:hypothetical protein
LRDDHFKADWAQGKRHATRARLAMKDHMGRDHLVTWEPVQTFMMKGIGYFHPDWVHGGWKGELAVEREDFRPSDLAPLDIANLHIQAIAKARHEGPDAASDGIGIVEQLAFGPHRPSGFEALLDGSA